MLRRAAPRVITVVLLLLAIKLGAASTTGVVASALQAFGFVLGYGAFGSKEWWQYVRHGAAAPWRVERGGTTALFVADAGRDPLAVAALLRRHGGLSFGEATERAEDPSRPVWDDLSSESADRIGVILTEAGATVRVGPRPAPSWARDVSRQGRG